MSYHELMMLIELADPPRLRVDTENYKYIEIEKKEFISLFEKKKMELGEINISIFQFREIFGNANIHSYQNIVYCFEKSKNIVSHRILKSIIWILEYCELMQGSVGGHDKRHEFAEGRDL